jgi:hypothetical protein
VFDRSLLTGLPVLKRHYQGLNLHLVWWKLF